jgi:hypothetical protein
VPKHDFWQSPQAQYALLRYDGSHEDFWAQLVQYVDSQAVVQDVLDKLHLSVDELHEMRKACAGITTDSDRQGPATKYVQALAMRGLTEEAISILLELPVAHVRPILRDGRGGTPEWYQAAFSLHLEGLTPTEIERELKPTYPTCRRQHVYRVLKLKATAQVVA